MHELSLAMGLCRQLARIRRERGATRIRAAVVEVGVLSNVVPELLRQGYLACREQVPELAATELVVRSVPLTLACGACGRTCETDALRLRCPECGSDRVTVRAGESLLLREVHLEIEEEDDERPASRRDGEPAQVQ